MNMQRYFDCSCDVGYSYVRLIIQGHAVHTITQLKHYSLIIIVIMVKVRLND